MTDLGFALEALMKLKAAQQPEQFGEAAFKLWRSEGKKRSEEKTQRGSKASRYKKEITYGQGENIAYMRWQRISAWRPKSSARS